MWLRRSLTALYVLQLLVLSSMVAACFFNITGSRTQESPQNSSRLSTENSTDVPQPTNDVIETSEIHLRAIPVSHVQSHLTSVKSPEDLLRLFAEPGVTDGQLSQWLEERQPVLVKPDLETLEAGQDDDGKSTTDTLDYQNDRETPFNQEVFTQALYHVEAVERAHYYPCKEPKPFVHYVRIPTEPLKYFVPECVLLYRCMNHSGCCRSPSQECGPKKVEKVLMAFYMFQRDPRNEDMLLYDVNSAVVRTFENHTECACQLRKEATECPKKCPEPFRVTREVDSCICRCFSQGHLDQKGRQCEKIRHGAQELSQDGLVCIKENKCFPPSCEVGTFNVLTGLCPLSDQYALPRYLFNSSEQQRNYRQHISGFLVFPTYNTSLTAQTRNKTARPPPTTTTSTRPPRVSGPNDIVPLKYQGSLSSSKYHENPNRQRKSRRKPPGAKKPQLRASTSIATASSVSKATTVATTINESSTSISEATKANPELTITILHYRRGPDPETSTHKGSRLNLGDHTSASPNTTETMIQSDMPAHPVDTPMGEDGTNKNMLPHVDAKQVLKDFSSDKSHAEHTDAVQTLEFEDPLMEPHYPEATNYESSGEEE